jgi:hypothetical protein
MFALLISTRKTYSSDTFEQRQNIYHIGQQHHKHLPREHATLSESVEEARHDCSRRDQPER